MKIEKSISKFDENVKLYKEKDLPEKQDGSGELVLILNKGGVEETRKKTRYHDFGSTEVLTDD